jgi:hypothetical protein
MAKQHYKILKKQASSDGGVNWYDVYPLETIKYVTDYDCEKEIFSYLDTGSAQLRYYLTNGVLNRGEAYSYCHYRENITSGEGKYGTVWGSLVLMPDAEEIGTNAFGTYAVPNTQTLFFVTINYVDFKNATNLKVIGGSAFGGQYYFSGNIIIPDNVTTIGDNAFNGCKLNYITIGSGVTYIGSGAFANQSSGPKTIKEVHINATVPPSGVTAWTFAGKGNFSQFRYPIYVPCESLEAYKTAEGWSDYASRLFCAPIDFKIYMTFQKPYTTTKEPKTVKVETSKGTFEKELANTWGITNEFDVFQVFSGAEITNITVISSDGTSYTDVQVEPLNTLSGGASYNVTLEAEVFTYRTISGETYCGEYISQEDRYECLFDVTTQASPDSGETWITVSAETYVNAFGSEECGYPTSDYYFTFHQGGGSEFNIEYSGCSLEYSIDDGINWISPSQKKIRGNYNSIKWRGSCSISDYKTDTFRTIGYPVILSGNKLSLYYPNGIYPKNTTIDPNGYPSRFYGDLIITPSGYSIPNS